MPRGPHDALTQGSPKDRGHQGASDADGASRALVSALIFAQHRRPNEGAGPGGPHGDQQVVGLRVREGPVEAEYCSASLHLSTSADKHNCSTGLRLPEKPWRAPGGRSINTQTSSPAAADTGVN